MSVTAVVQRSDFDAALAAAREVGRGEDVSGLARPLGAAALARLDEAWAAIEGALENAYEHGKEVTQQALARATDQVQTLFDAAGTKRRELQELILARLQRYVSDLISHALDRVESTIKVGSRTLALASVEVSQTISLTGSLKVNLIEVLNMAAQGQLVVAARYADEPPGLGQSRIGEE